MLKLYSILDKKAQFFGNPWVARTDGEAIRSFTQAVNGNDSPFGKFPDDYALYALATFDEQIGDILSMPREMLIEANQVIEIK